MVDSFSRAMRDCTEIQGSPQGAQRFITFDCTPVAVSMRVAAGVVISFQNVDKRSSSSEEASAKIEQ